MVAPFLNVLIPLSHLVLRWFMLRYELRGVHCRSLLWKFIVQSLCVWGGRGASHGKGVQSRQQPSGQQCASCSTISKNELNLETWRHCVVCHKKHDGQPDVARKSQQNKVRNLKPNMRRASPRTLKGSTRTNNNKKSKRRGANTSLRHRCWESGRI